jgi:hypothetical protein
MNKQTTRVWTFASDSNPNIEYETLQYTDGSTSCNCKGWTRRVAADETRSWKHTRYVDMGIAKDHCTATHAHTQSGRWLIAPSAKPYSNREAAETDPGVDTAGPKPDGDTTDAKPYREAHAGCITAGRIRT